MTNSDLDPRKNSNWAHPVAGKLLIALVLASLLLCFSPLIANQLKGFLYQVVHPEIQVVDIENPKTLDFFNDGTPGTYSIDRKLTDGNTSYELMPTFDDAEATTKTVNEKASKTIHLLQSKFLFPLPLTTWDWQVYKWMSTAMYDRADCPDWYGESDEGFSILQSYFDVIENNAENDAIVAKAKSEGIQSVAQDLRIMEENRREAWGD